MVFHNKKLWISRKCIHVIIENVSHCTLNSYCIYDCFQLFLLQNIYNIFKNKALIRLLYCKSNKMICIHYHINSRIFSFYIVLQQMHGSSKHICALNIELHFSDLYSSNWKQWPQKVIQQDDFAAAERSYAKYR